ncbi:M24 family metallopeptidase [Candidatus Nitrosocosmicus franklandus]|uniref:Putative peptidase n=1 Tax=Candidatus Nitrosocosmicus franklandianus TaxID=1798806 RepID=A0A484IFV6_9ARCH|nr:M24 family metallopeptidase [Candidatus Nitrosocosmicus franklandus]VFJ15040.1 putative peptidase [Candidatus Nitrosocosmicus franklandus]
MKKPDIRKQRLLISIEKKLGKIKQHQRLIMVIDKPEDIFYYTGFWGEGILIIDQDLNTKLIVPRLEYYRAQTTSRGCEVIPSERGKRLTDSISKMIKSKTMICYGGNDYMIATTLTRHIEKQNFHIAEDIVQKNRQIKDKQEIEKIKIASKIIDRLFTIAQSEIKINRSEEEIQSTLVYEALRMGARFPNYQFTSNPLIVASGPNGSFPHAETSSRKIKNGELVVLDITLSYDHYVSDATRTFGVGNVPKKIRDVYCIVKDAQESAINRIKTTNNFAEIDSECRRIIKKAGFGEFFIHSTGHGVGLEVHELPWIRPNVDSTIEENMTITIEPGIYVEKKYGIRIEDSLWITSRKSSNKKSETIDHFDPFNFHNFDKGLIVI